MAGSIAPIADCYRPDLSPPDPGPAHARVAQALSAAGCDLLLCETFPNVREGLSAVEGAVATGRPVWASFTAGYRGDLLTPLQVGRAGRAAVDRGAQAVLVNCVPASQTLPFVAALLDAIGDDVPVGAYANAGPQDGGLGWGASTDGAERYADLALGWIEAGARIVGGCCGTDAATVRAVARRLGRGGPPGQQHFDTRR